MWISIKFRGKKEWKEEKKKLLVMNPMMRMIVCLLVRERVGRNRGESSGNSSCKIEEIEDEASSVPNINKAQCKSK